MENALSALSVQPEAPDPKHWRQLRTLLERSAVSATFRLRTPSPSPCPPKPVITSLFRACTDASQRRLLTRHLLTCLARQDNDASHLQGCLRQRRQRAGFSPDAWDDLFRARWLCVPLPVVQGRQGRLVFLMLALLPGTGRVRPLEGNDFSPESITALHIALSLWNDRQTDGVSDMPCWLLDTPAHDSPLAGASLGLPAALGLHLLAEHRPWPAGLFATGALDTRGKVLPVRGIRRKLEAVARHCALFLAPSGDTLNEAVPAYVVAAATLADARLALECYGGGIRQTQDLTICCLVLHEPDQQLPRQFDRLPVAFFRMPALHDRMERLRREVLANAGKLAPLSRCLRQHSADLERADALRGLFHPEDILRLADADPAPALEWCLGMMALHNHLGDVAAGRGWSACADAVMQAMGGSGERFNLTNKRMVGERFNRYDFRPEPPEFFSAALQDRQRIHRMTGGNDATLGAMYGTLAQNFAYCGPGHLPRCRTVLDKARQAFGRAHPAELPRLQSYLVLALLDAGQKNAAVAALRDYLGIPADANAVDWPAQAARILAEGCADAPFRLHVLCRVLADRPDIAAGTEPRARWRALHAACLGQHRHPWQLVAINLARLCLRAEGADDAERLLRHAVEICRTGEETLRVMALLPLALLQAHGLANELDHELAAAIGREIRASAFIHQEHFHRLDGLSSGRDMLQQVHAARAALFPFSYR